jgi:hypothetical protein
MSAWAKSLLTSASEPQSARLVILSQFIKGDQRIPVFVGKLEDRWAEAPFRIFRTLAPLRYHLKTPLSPNCLPADARALARLQQG